MSDVAIDPSPGLDSAMDSFFSPSADAGAPPDPGSDSAAGAPPAPDAPGEPGAPPEPTQPAEGGDLDPAQPPAADPPPPVADPAAADLPEGAQVDGKNIRIDVSRFNNIYRDYKFAQELRAIAPDVKTAQLHYQRATDLRHMHADFTAGNVDAFLDYWNAQSPEQFGSMAAAAIARAPEAVRTQINQQAVSSFFDQLYAKAAETGDPQDLYKARQAEYWATGDWRKDTAPKVDPLAAREKSIADRENALKQGEQQRAEAQWKGWQNQTYATIGTETAASVDKLLEPLKARFEAAPDLFNTLRNSIKTQGIKQVEADQEWLRNFNMDMAASRRTMSPGDRQALVQHYKARFDRVVTAIASPLIKQATGLLVQQNQSSHSQLAAGSARRGAAAPGAPVRTSVTTGQRDRSAMSLDEKIDADMA